MELNFKAMNHTAKMINITAIIFQIIICFCGVTALRNSSVLQATNDCTCLGHTIIYECTVEGDGATVWKGEAFDCTMTDDEILLFHSNPSSIQIRNCNSGAITAIIIQVQDNIYTSQLTVNVSTELNGTDITCVYDNGELNVIGSELLIISSVPFPPTNVHFVDANSSHDQLVFKWTGVFSTCSVFYYRIIATNCGLCPETTSFTAVTCFGNFTETLSTDFQCSFAVQTVVCDDTAGDISTAVNVTLTDIETSTAAKGTTDTTTRPNAEFAVILTSILVSVTTITIMVAITLILGFALVCLMLKPKFNLKSTSRQQWSHQDSTVNRVVASNRQQTSTHEAIYTDISLDTTNITHQQNLSPSFDDSVAYTEIRYQSETHIAPADITNTHTGTKCIRSELRVVNLEILLILLKDDISLRWYEFGLVVGVPKEELDHFRSLYSSDQCAIEVLCYWLRHHPGQITWNDVANAASEIELHHLAGKVLQISMTGRLPADFDPNYNLNHLQTKNHDAVSPPPVPPKGNV